MALPVFYHPFKEKETILKYLVVFFFPHSAKQNEIEGILYLDEVKIQII